MKKVLGIILGGGQGTRLFPLTIERSKPAVPIGGKYRLIDLAVSNCIHSDIMKIYVLTQFNSASLNRHVVRTYSFGRFSEGFVEILAAEQTPENKNWFQGTADAVRQSYRYFTDWNAEEFLILAGDHLYRMDYRDFVRRHRQAKADFTISVTPVSEHEAAQLGILKVDAEGRITEFREKPSASQLPELRSDTTQFGLPPGQVAAKPYLASMGIYVVSRDVLGKLLFEHPGRHDFGKEIIPECIPHCRVYAHVFPGYWEDIGTIGAFYRANMDLTMPSPKFNFFDPAAPIYTRPRFLPGSRLRNCQVHDSIIAEGCLLDGGVLTHTIAGIRSRVRHGAVLERSLVMGADFYQSDADLAGDDRKGIPHVGIGELSVVSHAIVDKNARIGRGVKILNEAGLQHHDGKGYYIRDGIVIVPKNAIIADGAII